MAISFFVDLVVIGDTRDTTVVDRAQLENSVHPTIGRDAAGSSMDFGLLLGRIGAVVDGRGWY